MAAEFTSPMAEETADVMGKLAEIFVEGVTEEGGPTLGWAEHDAALLDSICDAFLRSDPADDVQHSMIMSMGAYLGELIIRASSGRWGYDKELREAVIETGDGLLAWPHSKVAKRLEKGSDQSLFRYYSYAVHPEQRT